MQGRARRYGAMVAGLVLLPVMVWGVIAALGLTGPVWDLVPVLVLGGVVFLMIGMGVRLAWRLAWMDTWEREGRCVNCGYDRTGRKSGDACPECGERGV